MRNDPALSFRQCAIWVFILGGHALLIFLLSTATRDHERRGFKASDFKALVWLELNPPIVLPPPQTLEREPVEEARPRANVTPFQAPANPSSESTAPMTNEPAIDWHGEAGRVARDAVAEEYKFEKRECDPSDPPTSVLPKCTKPLPEYEWNPVEKRGGLAPLPYVRVRNCVVGLGFFGCGFGKPPPPSDDLYKRMKDPNRPTSSVPDVDAINKLPLGKASSR